MSFAFKRKECLADGVCRIARKQVAKALKSCSKNSAESIHTTRKQIKKLRALLHLVRRGVGKNELEKALDYLRHAARFLAGPRDSHVKVKAFKELIGPRGRKSSSDDFFRIRADLKRESREQTQSLRTKGDAQKVRQILRKMPHEFERLHFKEGGWDILGPAIKKAHKAAHDARDCLLEDAAPQKFHEWRKSVKDLLYTVQLLEPIQPDQMAALSAGFEKLTELLGDDHDLEMLRQTVAKKSVEVAFEGDAQRLLPLIQQRQMELRRSALKLGKRLFNEKASSFGDRLHQYWNGWKFRKRKHVQTLATV